MLNARPVEKQELEKPNMLWLEVNIYIFIILKIWNNDLRAIIPIKITVHLTLA